MAKFTFKLEPVLRARQGAEQARQRALADLHRERIALEDVLRLHQQQIDQTRGTMREALVGVVNTNDLRGHTAATMRLMGNAQKIAIELASVHQRIEQARNDLLEATKARRAIELLRDKRMAEWKASLSKAEDSAMDELAVTAAARRNLEVSR